MPRIPSAFEKLPSSWLIVKVGDMLRKNVLLGHMDGNHGGDYPRAEEFVNDGVPYISANSLKSGIVDFSLAKYLTPQRASQMRKGKAKNSDVLFAHNATVGPVAILQSRSPYVILSTTLTYYRCNPDKLSNEYLKAFLESAMFRRQYEPLMAQSTRNQVPITTQREFFVVLPPLAEQHAIARILGTWDEAIALTESLIEALQQRKKGLMQKLLTGEVRFPGFDDAWEEVQTTDILRDDKGSIKVGPFGSQLKKQDMVDAGYKVYGQENVYEEDFRIGNRYIASNKFKQLQTCEVRPGDFLVSMMGTIGKTAIVPDSIEQGIMDSHLMRLRINEDKYSKRFLQHLFGSYGLMKQVSRASVGGIMDGLSSGIVQKLKLPLPKLDEQNQIAHLLDMAQYEISFWEGTVKELQQQKKGLMQQLLTGQVRVKVGE